MRKLLFALPLLLLSLSASAQVFGPAKITALQPAEVAGGQCAYFQVANGAPGAYYSIDTHDTATFPSQMALLIFAFGAQTPLTFGTLGEACGYPKIQYMFVGTQN